MIHNTSEKTTGNIELQNGGDIWGVKNVLYFCLRFCCDC